MSATIDERIVQMEFDNAAFEKHAKQTMKTLEKLEKSLDLENSAKSLEQFQKAANHLSLAKLSSNLDSVIHKFSMLGIVGISALNRLTNQAIDTGETIIKSLTVDPVKTGLQEYETQIGAIQTILANTQRKGSTLEDVNNALDELNHYADLTIYNFTEMTRNIGTFTAAGIGLEDSVKAIKGIANLGAVAGSNSQQVSTAMYQLSQALSTGTVRLMDWNSVVNAGMGGEIFQESLKETARVHGIEVDAMIAKEGSFRESLQHGWLTSEVLIETLQKFTGDLTDDQLRSIGYTEEQIKGIKELATTAINAATKVKTVTQLFSVLKETAQSGWTESWENVIGTFEEAQNTLTNVSYVFQNIITASSNARNELLSGWKELGGRTALIEIFVSAFNTLSSILVPIKRALRDIFPPATAQSLYKLTTGLRDFIRSMQLTTKQEEKLRRSFKGLFAILDSGITIVSSIVTPAIRLLSYVLGGSSDNVLDLSGNIGDLLVRFRDWIKSNNVVLKGANELVDAIILIIKQIKIFVKYVKELKIVQTTFTDVVKYLKSAGKGIKDFTTGAEDFITGLIDVLQKIDFKNISTVHAATKVYVESLSEAKNKGNNSLESIRKKTDEVVNFIIAKFKSIKPEHIAAVGFIAGMASIISTLNKIGNAAESIGSLVTSFQKGFNNLINTFLKMKQSGTVNNILKVAVSVGILAASVKMLSDIDAMGLLKAGAMIAALAIILRIMQSFPESGNISDSLNTFLVFSGFAVAIKSFAKAVKLLSGIKWKDLAKSIAGAAALSFILLEFSSATIKFPKTAIKSVIAMSLMGPAIYIFAKSLSALSSIKFDDISKSIKSLITVIGFIGLLNVTTRKMNSSAIWSLIPMAAGLNLLIKTLHKIGDFSLIELRTVLTGMIRVLELLAGVMLVSRLAGKNAKSVSKIMISLGLSLNLMILAIKGINYITSGEIDTALEVIGKISLCFGAIIALSYFSGEHSRKAASLIKSMSIAMIALTGVISILSLFTEETVDKGLRVIGTIDLLFSILLLSAGRLSRNKNATKGLKVAAIALTALVSLVGLFSFIKEDKVKSGIAAVTSVSVAISVLIFTMSKLKDIKMGKKELATLGMIEIAIGALGGIFATIAQLTDFKPQNILALSAGVSMLTVAMGALLALTQLMKVDDVTNFGKTVGILTIVMGALGALLVLGVNNLSNSEDLLPLVTTTSIALLALSACCKIVSGIDTKAAATGALGLSAFISILTVVFLAIGGIIQTLDSIGGESGTAINQMYTTIEALKALGEGIGGFVGGIFKGAGEGILSLLPMVGTNLSQFMQNLQPFMTYLQSYKGDGLDGANKIVSILLKFSAASFINSIQNLIPFSKSFKPKEIKSMFKGIGEAYSLFAKSVEGITDHDSVKQAANAAEVLVTLSKKLPRTNGIFQLWFGQKMDWTTFGNGLAAFGTAFRQYAIRVGKIENFDIIKTSAEAAESLAILQSVLPSTGGRLQEWFGEKTTLDNFGDGLITFGEGLKGYSDAVQGVDSKLIETTANAAGALAILANTLPEAQGVLQTLFGGGNITLSTFADQLIPFAVKMVNYSDALNSVDEDILTKSNAAVDAITALSTLSTAIVGNIDLSGMGQTVYEFGTKFKDYSNEVSQADFETIQNVVDSLRDLKEFTDSLNGTSDDGLGLLSLGASLRRLGNTGLEEFIRSFTDGETKLTQTGKDVVTFLVNGMLNRFATSKTIIMSRSIEIGAVMAQGISKSINDNLSSIEVSTENISKTVIDKVDKDMQMSGGSSVKMKIRGEAASRSYATGIEGGAYMAVDAASRMSHGVLKASEDVVNTENKVGEIFDQTTIDGIVEKAEEVKNSAKSVVSNAIDEALPLIDKGLDKLPKSFKEKINDMSVALGKTGISKISDSVEEFTDYWGEEGGGGIFDLAETTKEASNIVSGATDEISSSYDDLTDGISSSAKKIVDIDNEILSEEEEYWRTLLRIKRQGSEADKYNALSVKEFEEEIFNETLNIWKEYTDKLTSTADSIMNSHNLFDAVGESEAKSKEELFKNLDAQIEEYRQYAETLATVTFRLGDDSQLAEYLRGLGVESLSQLKVINQMTDEELTRYAQLYDTKYSYATNIASQQITDFRNETESKLENLYGTMAGSVNLDEFVQNFTGTFDSITNYLNTVALPMSDSIKASMESLQQSAGESISANNGYITDALDKTFNDVKNTYNSKASSYGEETGTFLDQGIAKGILDSSYAKVAAAKSVNDIQNAYQEAAEIQSPSQRMADNVGLYITEGVGQGMTSRMAKLYILKKVLEVVAYIENCFSNEKNRFIECGKNAGQGFAQGMMQSITSVMNAAGTVANASAKATQNALDEHSPSRVFNKIGQFAMEGFAQGIRDLSTLPGDEMRKATDDGIKAAEFAIKSINNVLENGTDDRFTIRPIMDLTDIESGTMRISNMLSRTKGINAASTIERNQQIKDQQAQKETFGTNYTFNQYNTSPKALSTIDIYRRTKNQFSMLKGVTSI